MNKHKKLIGVLGAVAVLLGGYFALSSWASEQAVREVRIALLESNLDRAVRYRDVSASLLGGAVTLHDVEIRDADGRGNPVTAARVVVSDIEKDHDQLTAIRLRFEGLNISVLEAARRPDDAGALLRLVSLDTRYELIGMGYSNLNGTVEMYGQLDPDLREARAEIEADFDGFQVMSGELAMSGVDRDVLKALIDAQQLLASQSIFSLLSKGPQIVEAASRLELMDLHLSIKDRGLHDRMQTALAEKYLVPGDGNKRALEIAESAKRDVVNELFRRDSDPRIIQDVAKRVAGYVENGGTLSLTTNIAHPLPLFERGGMLGIKPAPVIQNFERFMLLADARLDH